MFTSTVDLSETRAPNILALAWILCASAIITVAIKLFARTRIVKVVGWDDFFIFVSLVSHISKVAHDED